MPTITVTSVDTRQDPNVPFFEMTEEEKNHRKTNYIQTGKILFGKMTLSEDKLVRTLVTVYIDNDARNTYRNDPVLVSFRERRNAYYSANGIVHTMSFESE
jgi:hypothetical protein